MSTRLKTIISLSTILILLLGTISFAADSDFYVETRKINLTQLLKQVNPDLIEEKETTNEEVKPKEIEDNNTETEKEKIKDEEREINIIWVNVSSPTIDVKTAFAEGGIGTVATLDNIVKNQVVADGHVVAAINGGYFEVGGDRQTYGTYFNNGDVVHIGDIGSLATFGGNNQFSTLALYTAIEGSINGQWQEPNNFKAWNINHFMDNDDALLIFDSFYNGIKPQHNYNTITVINNVVTRIDKGSFNIPSNGFLILTKDKKQLTKFKLGDKINYRFRYYPNLYNDNSNKGERLYLDKIKSAVGAGPILLKDGQVVADPVKEGFFENKINYTRAKRSFIGINDYNMMAMATVDNVTILELAEIAKSLGLIEAINLDGGGSTGLYYNNEYLTPSKRKIANAIIVSSHNQPKSKLIVNQREVFSNYRDIIKTDKNRQYVLMSELAKALDSRFSYSPLSKIATLYRYQKRYTINCNDLSITDNTTTEKINILKADDDHDFYISIDDLAKIMPLESIYDKKNKTLRIQIKTIDSIISSANLLKSSGKYQASAELYQQALIMDYKNITILGELGDLYKDELNNLNQAIDYYKKALNYSPNDAYILVAYSDALSKKGDLKAAEKNLEKVIELYPQDALGYYQMGIILSEHHKKKEAKLYFENALKHQPKEKILKDIEKRLR